jgi:hydrogenase nickel incorporation protein HypA/HybF
MHELSICQALISQVEKIADDKHANQVTAIHIGMGPLSGVEEQLLKNAYPIASASTVADGAELFITSIPVCIRCTKCEKDSEVKPNHLVCSHCGDWRSKLTSGDELLLMRVELDKAEKPESAEVRLSR